MEQPKRTSTYTAETKERIMRWRNTPKGREKYREYQREYMRKYTAENREKVRERNRAAYLRRKERMRIAKVEANEESVCKT